jgi:hypothetical protein
MATMMTTIMKGTKKPKNGSKSGRGKVKASRENANGGGGKIDAGVQGGKAGAKSSTTKVKIERESNDDERLSNDAEELPDTGTKMKLRTSPRKQQAEDNMLTAVTAPIAAQPTYQPVQPAPMLNFYDVFLRREEERRRDKEAMEAMLVRMQEERDRDKKRIRRLEEAVRTLSASAGSSRSRTNGNGGSRNGSMYSFACPPGGRTDEGGPAYSTTASDALDMGMPAHMHTHPYPPSHAHHASPTAHAPATLGHLPSSFQQTPVLNMIGVVEAVAWKREQHQQQQQQRDKLRNEREQAKVREMEQLIEEGKILPNVEELEIEQFFA